MKRKPSDWVRAIALACALALACFAVPAVRAEADGAADILEIEFSITPGEMAAPGDATMTFIISNRSAYDVQNLCITSADGLLSEPIGQIGAGETQTLVRPHAVTQEELDAGAVRCVVSHDAVTPGGEKITHALAAALVRGEARPDVDFTRQLSSQTVAAGGQLTVTYRLTNNGNVPASGIVVRDALGDFTGRLDLLEPGAAKTFVNRVTVASAAESDASLEYVLPSGETFARKLDPIAVRLSDSALEASFTVGRSAFDSDRADAILTLTSVGADGYADLTVLDDVYGGVIAEAVSVPGGGNPVEISCAYPVRGDGEYRWRVTGTGPSGDAVEFVTETIRLRDDPEPRQIAVSLYAAARTPKISRAGRVTFDLQLANTGTAAAQALRLYEVNRGDVRSLAVLPTGEPCRLQVSYEVAADESFIFCLNYTDAGGHPRTVSAAPVDVEITPSGVPPERADGAPAELEGGSVKLGTTQTFTILLIVASAALVSMFTILLVTSLRARKDRRRRIAAERQRIREELGKTNRFTPIKDDPRRKRRKRPAAKKKKQ